MEQGPSHVTATNKDNAGNGVVVENVSKEVHQLFDIVAKAPSSKFTKIGKVPTDGCRVNANSLSNLLGARLGNFFGIETFKGPIV